MALRERASDMPDIMELSSRLMSEEGMMEEDEETQMLVEELALSLEEHGVEHQKTKAIMDRIETRVGAERAAELRAKAEDKAFGLDKKAPKSQLPASGGTADSKDKSGTATAKGGQDAGEKLSLKGGPPTSGGRTDRDAKSKLPPAAGGGRADASEQSGAAAGGGRGDTGR